MKRPRVLLTRRWPAEVEVALAERYDLVINASDEALTASELTAALDAADAVCPTVTDALTASVIGAARPRARFLGNFGVGFNHIDLEAARAAGLAAAHVTTPEAVCAALGIPAQRKP